MKVPAEVESGAGAICNRPNREDEEPGICADGGAEIAVDGNVIDDGAEMTGSHRLLHRVNQPEAVAMPKYSSSAMNGVGLLSSSSDTAGFTSSGSRSGRPAHTR